MKITQVVAMALAGIIGVMSIVSGSSVLLGFREVGYTVLNWLVVYNVIVGVLSVITAFLIWNNFILSKKIISLILCSHAAVMTYLSFFSETVSTESIKAMIFRVGVWLVIFILMLWTRDTKSNSIKTEKS